MKRAGPQADEHAKEAVVLIRSLAEGLSPERAEAYLSAAPVASALELVR